MTALVVGIYLIVQDATVRQLCGRLLAVCFEAQRLVQTGKEHLADIESVPIDLRRNLEDLAAKFVNDFGRNT
jgi:hypothetical protein